MLPGETGWARGGSGYLRGDGDISLWPPCTMGKQEARPISYIFNIFKCKTQTFQTSCREGQLLCSPSSQRSTWSCHIGPAWALSHTGCTLQVWHPVLAYIACKEVNPLIIQLMSQQRQIAVNISKCLLSVSVLCHNLITDTLSGAA